MKIANPHRLFVSILWGLALGLFSFLIFLIARDSIPRGEVNIDEKYLLEFFFAPMFYVPFFEDRGWTIYFERYALNSLVCYCLIISWIWLVYRLATHVAKEKGL